MLKEQCSWIQKEVMKMQEELQAKEAEIKRLEMRVQVVEEEGQI